MFALFKKSQKTNVFNIQYNDFVSEYKTLVNKADVIDDELENPDKDFVEITDCQIAAFQELIYSLDELLDRITSTLIPITTEQEVEKITLQNIVTKAKSKAIEYIDWALTIENAYIQGLQDGYNLEKD